MRPDGQKYAISPSFYHNPMKWPWVRREAMDEAEGCARELIGRCAAMQERAEKSEARYETLLDRYHDLVARKANGDGLPPAKMPEPPAPDLVLQAIAERPANERAHLYQWARTVRRQRDEGLDVLTDGAMIQQIVHGVSEADPWLAAGTIF